MARRRHHDFNQSFDMDMSIWKDVDVLRDEISKSYRHLAFDDYSTCPPSLPMVETCMPLPHVLSFL